VTAAALPIAADNRGARIGRAYALIAALVGREWVSRQELDVALGCSKRTTLRNISEASSAGLIEVHRGRRGDDATRVRLVNRRLRVAA
jgi:hypothetical protein